MEIEAVFVILYTGDTILKIALESMQSISCVPCAS